MVLGLEIGLLIAGLFVLIKGRFKLGKNRVATGAAARIAGLVFLLPLPVAFGILMIVNLERASQGTPNCVGNCRSAIPDVTRILSAIEQGDPHAPEQLLPLVYDELRKPGARKLGQEKPGQILQATALVHEAYLRLVESERRGSSPPWSSRGPPPGCRRAQWIWGAIA